MEHGNLAVMATMIEKIVATIEARGLTQVAVEQAAMLSANRLSKWKNGTGEPSARELLRIARVLGVSYADLFDDAMAADEDSVPYKLSRAEHGIMDIVRDLGIAEARRRLLQKGPVFEDAEAPAPARPKGERPPESGRRERSR